MFIYTIYSLIQYYLSSQHHFNFGLFFGQLRVSITAKIVLKQFHIIFQNYVFREIREKLFCNHPRYATVHRYTPSMYKWLFMFNIHGVTVFHRLLFRNLKWGGGSFYIVQLIFLSIWIKICKGKMGPISTICDIALTLFECQISDTIKSFAIESEGHMFETPQSLDFYIALCIQY